MERTLWIDRKFNFEFPTGWLPNIIERLRGTTPRIIEMTSTISDSEGRYNYQNKWSIKENIGHLSDLEELHDGRIDDFLSRKEQLRPADMSNAKTYAENYNQADLHQLINEFTMKRTKFIKKLLALDDDTQVFKSFHPRLKIMMRPIDVAFFTAEHDDHHLADIRFILNHFNK